ncbi:monocarboxylate permease-like protein [Aspergillus affinis]|uniref:monocarboxylate permease-like protein n=1 Tax=Aspergillus affinis TaxID=1070780 RepID=UPI0022FEB026|nr:monocarboxylate permease-like protein [Aspergillus affinis]KAI9037115.1 monocarboxylate permease-like protein [Aspergillus affinis]
MSSAVPEQAPASHLTDQQPGRANVSEKGPPDASGVGSAPDGGLRAWLVAAGAASVFFCTLGLANSFGTFVEYYLTHQLKGDTASSISWIGSLQSFLQFFSGMLGGRLFDRFGANVFWPSAIFYLFAMMMLSLCKTYWQAMLVQGVLIGLVMGFLQIPAFAAVSQYFDKKRAGALGLAVAGSSIGGVIMPIILSKGFNGSSLGFGWTSRFLMLVTALFFMFVGMFTPMFYLTTYATTQGMGATLAGYLPALVNAASTIGRIVPGVLADQYGRLNTFAVGGVTTGILVFCMTSATSNAALIVYAVFFGLCSGAIVSGAAATFSSCPDNPQDIGTYMGMGMAISGLGTLVGPPSMAPSSLGMGGFLNAACSVVQWRCLAASLHSLRS